MDMNLSIVVPIYNVESYLEACLNSIEPILSNENVELILVNDGSKDGSEDICYKYIDKISNTKYIYIRITKDCRRREIPE
ncbi:TPA: glycosyltransferase [Neisseria gonorrhoeae]